MKSRGFGTADAEHLDTGSLRVLNNPMVHYSILGDKAGLRARRCPDNYNGGRDSANLEAHGAYRLVWAFR